MHIGRSHHIALTIGSVIGGFAVSFLTFTTSQFIQLGGMKGQLVAGDPNINKELPTMHNAFQGVIDGSNPITSSLSSYGFWVMVSIGGIISAIIIFKILRRFV